MQKFGVLIAGWAALISWSVQAQPGTKAPRLPEGEFGVDYNVVDAAGKRQGAWVRVWPDGTLYYEGQFADGQPTGTFNFYFETGELMSRIEHADDPRFMQATHFNPDGKVRATGGYWTSDALDEAGEPVRVKDGDWKYFDGAGTLRVEEHWTMGALDGIYAAYDNTGRMVEKGEYASGEKNGTWMTYNERGKILNRVQYAGGQFHGDYEVNDDLGRNLVVGRHAYGQPIGAWVHYNADRTVHFVRKFEEGEIAMERFENGLQSEFYKDERPKLEVRWENGKRHGAFKEWHDNGEWAVVEHLDPATGETESQRVIQGQTVAREGTYFSGELHGVVMTYNEAGRIVSRETYDHGQLVERPE